MSISNPLDNYLAARDARGAASSIYGAACRAEKAGSYGIAIDLFEAAARCLYAAAVLFEASGSPCAEISAEHAEEEAQEAIGRAETLAANVEHDAIIAASVAS